MRLALGLLMSALGASSAVGQQFAASPKVDKIFAEWDKPSSPGCALGVLQNDRFVYERGYGMANLDYDIPNSPTLVYYVGSDSKQFTAASIALLVLDGKIALDDDIRKYIPEMPDYGTPITVRHLIHHTSGIRDIYVLMSLGGLRLEDVFSDSEEIALIARQKELNFKPGDDYLYSNSGYFLLAEIVKRVTGKSLRAFADERIFKPLGMTHTHFHDDPGHVMKGRAMSYEPDGKGGYRISYLQNFDKIGAGGLYTTVEDLEKWDKNFYTHQVGGDALQKMIHTRAVLNRGDTIAYAFGNNDTTYRGLRVDEHGGALMGYKAEILRFPEQHFSVLATCNLGSINPGPLAEQVADVYLGSKMGPAPIRQVAGRRPREVSQAALPALGPSELAAFIGDYYSDEVDATYHIAVADGALTLTAHHVPSQKLTASGPDSFRTANGLTLHFERSSGAAPTSFTVEAGRVRNIRFARR
ncbi:MAG TPA: serine hydrolase domain-containing protein [Gemmatimonadaceae bacterium]|nr:serine hydrolase domain-containing protein [Gemmatimonadaceae bacterium]